MTHSPSMLRKRLATMLLLIMSLCAFAQPKLISTDWNDFRWGDLGDGTFANPVLNADYSDPEVIRVGEKYYMVCSEFHYMGIPVLESDDMVNWRIIAQIFKQIDVPCFDRMEGYGDGTWAPSLRYHDGKFYMFVCMPNTGLYMSTAPAAEGPWAPLHHVKAIANWEDPCPFWDEDGNAYLGHSVLGAGPIIIHRMSADGRTLLDEGKTVYEGPVAEGTKIFKRDGYYYLSIPEGGVARGWQTILRSRNIYGPYEGKCVLETGTTPINGPHQGALVDTPSGEWWFYHFQERDPLGRVVHLQPVTWQADGFPMIGYDYDGNGIGEPMKIVRKPDTGKKGKFCLPQTSDNFDGGKLGVQWQTNHNPQGDAITMTARKGMLGIKALPATKVENAFNQQVQKMMGFGGVVTVRLYTDEMAGGQRAGISCLGRPVQGAGVMLDEKAVPSLYIEDNGEVKQPVQVSLKPGASVWIRLKADAVSNSHQYQYSLDGKHFTDLGGSFSLFTHGWKGAHVGLYSYTTGKTPSGTAFFDDFVYATDGGKKASQCPSSVEAVDLGLSVKWASCNVGASAPEEYGTYFAWGETKAKATYGWKNYFDSADGSSSNFVEYTVENGSGELAPEDDAAIANWGGEWRMPSVGEQHELVDKCDWSWTTLNGVNGYLVTSRTNGNSIFLPAAGYRWDKSLFGEGTHGIYWSRTFYPMFNYFAFALYTSFERWSAGIYLYRAAGRPVRAVCK